MRSMGELRAAADADPVRAQRMRELREVDEARLQARYDSDPQLQALLREASDQPVKRRPRRRPR